MDPNKAFESILAGHMVAEHAEALSEWLRKGGFDPEPRLHEGRMVKATMFGIEDLDDNILFTWSELENDSE